MYCLDSNTVIFYFKNKGNVAKQLHAKSRSELAISAIVAFELTAGANKSGNPKKSKNLLNEFLSEVTVLPFDLSCAREAATIRKQLESEGRTIGPFDILIAGAALAARSVLVTNNTGEFSRVKGLVLEDWL
jgi:tRNA(fMet)-specific endonuclease VapC